ncbi:NUDIX domain-containing protein [uncultured Tateyamaria sp.]|uniref:NUDIX domain-containing protein n=1 Tax=uncultured Tateyamaria sp. TaxID=455651 RepID=UPI002610461D|nr:NUDIX domain-containing protein [uncultured Tateyamaria sp.]
MKSIFFYGTLRHVPLLECVMGRVAGDLDIKPDVLPGHRIMAAVDGPYPLLSVDPDSDATGVLVRGLTADDIARLDYYEAGFAYDLQRLTLQSGAAADVYVPLHHMASDGPWDIVGWQQDWAEMSVAAAEEVMGSFGHVSAQEIARRFPRIRARAWSRVLAQSGHHSPDTLRGKVEIVERTRAYSDFFALDEIRMRHETFDGVMSPVLTRAVFVAFDAALVLPYDPVRDRVLLVEQVRLGPIGRHDPACWQLEPIAGMVDPGEQPPQAARREAAEEAGLVLDHMETVGAGYASPGSATDFFHTFVGICDLPDDVAGIGGAEAEGENIRSHLVSFDTLMGMAETGQIGNVPLTMLIYWLAHHRNRLRARRRP